MKIRSLLLSDFNLGLIEILKQLTNAPEINYEQFAKQYSNLSNNSKIYVLEDNNKIIGYGSVYIDHKFYRNCSNVGHIEDIIIDKNYRNQGLSKLLINKLIDYSKKQKCYKIILNCKEEYIKFYEKFGFKIDGISMTIR